MKSNLRRVSDEVYIVSDEIVSVDTEILDFLRSKAIGSPLRRARVCCHKQASDHLQEMLIALHRESYVRPHRHIGKAESFHVIEGEADVLILSEDGDINQIIEMGRGRNFYYRLDTPLYHTLLIQTDFFIIHETTIGPFQRSDTMYLPEAPDAGDEAGIGEYLSRLRIAAVNWKENAALGSS